MADIADEVKHTQELRRVLFKNMSCDGEVSVGVVVLHVALDRDEKAAFFDSAGEQVRFGGCVYEGINAAGREPVLVGFDALAHSGLVESHGDLAVDDEEPGGQVDDAIVSGLLWFLKCGAF